MLTASVVIFNTDKSQIDSLLQSIKNSDCIDMLYIIDNSPSSENEQFFKDCSLSTIIQC